ncbi:hypothetical protein [Planctomyces sp. SH-PL14]|uniref:hypothetical protein n=1 Tax=Planctomyces sp. SH-PL14 TaxID=1632864 RepID=UPI00078EADEF|nr:hypothetical protein [Planctomyces sp. SH-PL14]AMV21779.1 hypothetical protein VT03_28010 [Planctomyces sp. SH-PL14]
MKPESTRVDLQLKDLEDQLRRLREEIQWMDENTSIERRRRVLATAAFAEITLRKLSAFVAEAAQWLRQPPEDPPF